jgi:hypothetical protein
VRKEKETEKKEEKKKRQWRKSLTLFNRRKCSDSAPKLSGSHKKNVETGEQIRAITKTGYLQIYMLAYSHHNTSSISQGESRG